MLDNVRKHWSFIFQEQNKSFACIHHIVLATVGNSAVLLNKLEFLAILYIYRFVSYILFYKLEIKVLIQLSKLGNQALPGQVAVPCRQQAVGVGSDLGR
jgi:hypothetical protein